MYPDFHTQIVLKVINETFIKLKEKNHHCDPHEKLIDIQLRMISSDLLDDYADYLICSLPAIYYGQDEPKEFLFNKRFRNRTYQLYLMMEALFGTYAKNMSDHQMRLLNSAYRKPDNAIQIFFNDHLLYTLANKEDETILHELIRPRIKAMMDSLTAYDDLTEIRSRSYHANEELKFSLSKKAYNEAKKFIIHSYNEYY